MQMQAILIIAILLFCSKLAVTACERIKLPPVVGLILLGVILGRTGFDLAHSHDAFLEIETFAEIGVILLLFLAGTETDVQQLRRSGRNSLLIALGGVCIPFLARFALTYAFTHHFERALLMGTVLTATSVSVPVLTLADMNKLSSVEARTIINSAVIDDVIGIVFLSLVLGFMGVGGTSLVLTLGKIVGFFLAAWIVGRTLIPLLLRFAQKTRTRRMATTLAFAGALFFSWAAELSEVATITGAYLCGLFVGRTKARIPIQTDIEAIGETVFIPLFFVFIGMNTSLRSLHFDAVFLLLFVLIGIITKIVGSGGVARALGFDWARSFVIGAGMVPRGEVALIVASIASSPEKGHILNDMDNACVVVLVLLSVLVAPLLIKLGFACSSVTRKEV